MLASFWVIAFMTSNRNRVRGLGGHIGADKVIKEVEADFLKTCRYISAKHFCLPNIPVPKTCRSPNVPIGFHKNVLVPQRESLWPQDASSHNLQEGGEETQESRIFYNFYII